jgi:alkanesulfonate monooxygenase SsuD/methylene tetrahydromethanopterin reductase-like flavin-dependent oxidoreductase (luciferase family)
MKRACAEVGRDPATLRRSWCGGCACTPTRAQAEDIAGERYGAANLEEDFGFVGTPGDVIEQMRPFIKLGVSTFMLDCGGFPDLTTLELLIGEVLPAING